MGISGYGIADSELDFIGSWISSLGQSGGSGKLIELADVKQGWGGMIAGAGLLAGSPTVKGRVFGWGLAGHVDSEIILKAAKPLQRFRGFVGIEANNMTTSIKVATRAVFSIQDEKGALLWTSEPLSVESEAQGFDLKLSGQRELRLIARGEGYSLGHINWGEPVAETAGGDCVRIGASGPDFLPIDFCLGRESMREFITRCGLQRQERDGKTVFSSVDQAGGLALEFSLKRFANFPACEWHVVFENKGPRPTDLLHDVKSLCLPLTSNSAIQRTLLRGRGSFNMGPGNIPSSFKDSFLPVYDTLTSNSTFGRAEVEFGSSGRCSDPWLPYFNIHTPGQGGLVFAIGWAGQWKAVAGINAIEAGIGHMNARLLPGERIELPSIYMLRYEGDELLRGNNILRRFMREEISPRYNGQPVVPPACGPTWGGMSEKMHLERIKNIKDRKLPFDVYWIDAGWYGPEGTISPDEFDPAWARNAGTWKFNPTILPNGLKNISKAAHEANLKLLLWFEPERAIAGTEVIARHPEWFLKNGAGDTFLLNLGHPDACDWCINLISEMIESQGLDYYREDFNLDPLEGWNSGDAPDRQGITQIKAVAGLYRFWGELRRRFPRLVIDNCSSGGRRLDIELLRFSIPLWPSDMQCIPNFDPDQAQSHVAGLSLWLPFFAFGTQNEKGGDTYNFRSAIGAGVDVTYFLYERCPVSDDYPHEWLRERLNEFHAVKDSMSGDYYPLTESITYSPKVWSVSQYDRPDLGCGAVLVFRRKESCFTSANLRLQGLENDARYEVRDFDSGQVWTVTGSSLQLDGLKLELPLPYSSRLFSYKLVK